jgi:hypothetical protein
MPLNKKEFDKLKSISIIVTKGGAFNSMDPILFG